MTDRPDFRSFPTSDKPWHYAEDCPAKVTTDQAKAIEALAESWASQDGRTERFFACKASQELDDKDGAYSGYMADAQSLLERVQRRGFTLVPHDIAQGSRVGAEVPLTILTKLVDEFTCSIEQYHKIGPDWTMKDGTETFNVSVLLDREELLAEARAAIAAMSPAQSCTNDGLCLLCDGSCGEKVMATIPAQRANEVRERAIRLISAEWAMAEDAAADIVNDLVCANLLAGAVVVTDDALKSLAIALANRDLGGMDVADELRRVLGPRIQIEGEQS